MIAGKERQAAECIASIKKSIAVKLAPFQREVAEALETPHAGRQVWSGELQEPETPVH